MTNRYKWRRFFTSNASDYFFLNQIPYNDFLFSISISWYNIFSIFTNYCIPHYAFMSFKINYFFSIFYFPYLCDLIIISCCNQFFTMSYGQTINPRNLLYRQNITPIDDIPDFYFFVYSTSNSHSSILDQNNSVNWAVMP